MELYKIQHFLNEVASLKKKYDEIAELTGENFNIFQILKVGSSETRLHSAIIAELLNPYGAHGQKDVFLKLFLEQVKEETGLQLKLDTEEASVEIEKYIGVIDDNYCNGGRIDIVLTDKEKRRIIIENKIYAFDQKKQLVRYWNFDKKAIILYLTIDGKIPSDYSTDLLLEKDKDYFTVSYQKTILEWLRACQKESHNLPIIRETLKQYKYLLNILTNQTTNNKMNEDIKALILKDQDNFVSLQIIYSSYQELLVEIKANFFAEIKERTNEGTPLMNWKGYNIYHEIHEDNDYFYYGFHIEEGNNNIMADDPIFTPLVQVLKSINNNFLSNHNYLGWINSRYITKYDLLDKVIIYKMAQSSFQSEFINKIIDEFNEYRNLFLEGIREKGS